MQQMNEKVRRHGRSRAKFFLFFSLVLIVLSIYVFHRTPVKHHQNICMIFNSQPDWYRDVNNTQQQWGVPISTQMAIVYQESHYLAAAAPTQLKVFGVFAVHPSSAVGYAQALNQTWRLYLKETHQYSADRQSFSAASDFIGWFADRAHRQLGIDKSDSYHLYLAYHEGLEGYREASYEHQYWLKEVALHVAHQARQYRQQLLHCQQQLNQRQNDVFSAAPSAKLLGDSH